MTKSTSRQAFKENEESGLHNTIRIKVLWVIQNSPEPISQGECVAEHFPSFEKDCVAPRFNELKIRGLIKEAGKRHCRITGRLVETWVATFGEELPKAKKEKPSVIIARLQDANALMRNLLLELLNETLDNRISKTLGEIDAK